MLEDLAEDFGRIFNHLQQHEVDDVTEIVQALDVLKSNPRIGRPAENDRCELAIGRESRGYIALYRYAMELDTVFVEAIRAQREGGYVRD